MARIRDKSKRARIWSVVFTAVVLGTIVSATLFHIPPDWPLGGAEESLKTTPLSAKTWFDGSFAKDAEQWMLRRFGLRGFAIRLANQIGYSVFGHLPESRGTAIFQGKEGWLFESYYRSFYEKPTKADGEQIAKMARDLAVIQNYLLEKGTELVVVIAPSKLEVYSEYLPDGIEKTASRLSARDQVLEALRTEGVNHVDGRSLFLSWKKEPETPLLFPEYGIHWNAYGAQRILDEIWKTIGSPAPLPQVVGYKKVFPFGTDTDLLLLLNLPFYQGLPPRVPYPVLSDFPTPERPLSVLLVGDSFSHQLVDAIGRTGCFSKARHLYYFRTIFDYTWKPGEHPKTSTIGDHRTGRVEDHESVDWADVLPRYDVVILEFNEIYSRKAIWGFADFVRKDLPSSAASESTDQDAAKTSNDKPPSKP